MDAASTIRLSSAASEANGALSEAKGTIPAGCTRSLRAGQGCQSANPGSFKQSVIDTKNTQGWIDLTEEGAQRLPLAARSSLNTTRRRRRQ